MDEAYIYVAVDETGIVVLDMDGKLHNIIGDDICEYILVKKYAIDILNDEKNIYFNAGECLFKIDKGTYEIKYKKKYEDSLLTIVLQNSKYLFSLDANMIDKETGEVVDRISGANFAVDE